MHNIMFVLFIRRHGCSSFDCFPKSPQILHLFYSGVYSSIPWIVTLFQESHTISMFHPQSHSELKSHSFMSKTEMHFLLHYIYGNWYVGLGPKSLQFEVHFDITSYRSTDKFVECSQLCYRMYYTVS